jgi:NADPH:quinone reductase-like Zn-dependent oxidoreductase
MDSFRAPDHASPNRATPIGGSALRTLQRQIDLFKMVLSGKIRIEISKTYPLRDTPQAHADLEARKTTGSIVLVL